ncbi:RNF5_1 [Blepharisma stoltei]|uniref:RING-type E3 ubiquitin transferase n=1 Tax=Blepharisma stoltei TaxID=1481888 RepID=A0AAU9JQ35_9CILI|nr:unnamed protein product [Blepharisma stoltei]
MEEHRDSARFECLICFDVAHEPVLTLCGHLYCWSCIYNWLQQNRQSHTCPVCNSGISNETIIPIYTKEENRPHNENLPPRPSAQRQEPVRNEGYNPFRNLGERFGFAGPGEGVTMSAGFGFFPPVALLLATTNFSSGDSAYAPLDTIAPKSILACTMVLFMLLMFIAFI